MRLCFFRKSSWAVIVCAATWATGASAEDVWISDDVPESGYDECDASSACVSCGCRTCCCDPFIPMMIGADSPAPPRIAATGDDYTYWHRGMERIADNNSPLPQDRIAFSYNLLGDAPKVAGDDPASLDISEFDLLMERTLLDGSMSVGVNVPFSHTVSSYQVETGFSEGTELGNVSLILKGLLWCRPGLKVSGGVLMETPTSDDLVIDMINHRETLKTNAWYFSPFLAALATPSDRWFYHGFISYRDSTGPDDVVDDGDLTSRLRDPDLLMVDGGLGYWLYSNPCCRGLTGLVPTVELHYITTTTDMDGVSGMVDRRADYLALTSGVTARFGGQNTVALACALPLRSGDNPDLDNSDRLYDWQLALQWNHFYGR